MSIFSAIICNYLKNFIKKFNFTNFETTYCRRNRNFLHRSMYKSPIDIQNVRCLLLMQCQCLVIECCLTFNSFQNFLRIFGCTYTQEIRSSKGHVILEVMMFGDLEKFNFFFCKFYIFFF